MKILTVDFHLNFRNNSIACLRAKAQEHQALLNSGLLQLQVRSLAGLQHQHQQQQQLVSPLSSSPKSCDSGLIGNPLVERKPTFVDLHSSSPSPHLENNNNIGTSRNNNFNENLMSVNSDNSNIDVEDVKHPSTMRADPRPNLVSF